MWLQGNRNSAKFSLKFCQNKLSPRGVKLLDAFTSTMRIGVFFLQIACTYARPCMSKLVSEIKLMFEPCSLQLHDLKWKLYKAVDAKKITIYSLFVVKSPLGAGLFRLYGLLFTWSHNEINWVLLRLHSILLRCLQTSWVGL